MWKNKISGKLFELLEEMVESTAFQFFIIGVEYVLNKIRRVLNLFRLLFRAIWLRNFGFKIGEAYIHPKTNEVIKIIKYDIDPWQGSTTMVVFEVIYQGLAKKRAYTVYDWDDFVANFHATRKLNESEELYYMGSGNWKRVGNEAHFEVRPKREFKPEPEYSRTYMPGYDMGDWLTLKSDKEIYTVVQIVKIAIENYNNFYTNTRDELYIHFNKVEVKERPTPVNATGLKNMLRWELNRWGDNCISYTELLKDYRPLTDTEKLLYAKED